MDALAEYVEHLMTFVRMGDQTYAKWAAPKYERTDPFRLTGLAARLDVEIALHTKSKTEAAAVPLQQLRKKNHEIH